MGDKITKFEMQVKSNMLQYVSIMITNFSYHLSHSEWRGKKILREQNCQVQYNFYGEKKNIKINIFVRS